MTEELDHKTFDLIAVLSGRDYPTTEVKFYLNENLGLEIYRVEKKRQEALVLSPEEADGLDAEYKELVEKAKSEQYTAQLKSVSEQVRRDVINQVRDKFPVKTNMLGVEEPNPAGDEMFTKKMWSIYLQSITNPSGAVTPVTPDIVEAIYNSAPGVVHEAINGGIAELQMGPKAGFESAAKELNFLSDASPEG